jgi:hypothetical protein
MKESAVRLTRFRGQSERSVESIAHQHVTASSINDLSVRVQTQLLNLHHLKVILIVVYLVCDGVHPKCRITLTPPSNAVLDIMKVLSSHRFDEIICSSLRGSCPSFH